MQCLTLQLVWTKVSQFVCVDVCMCVGVCVYVYICVCVLLKVFSLLLFVSQNEIG